MIMKRTKTLTKLLALILCSLVIFCGCSDGNASTDSLAPSSVVSDEISESTDASAESTVSEESPEESSEESLEESIEESSEESAEESSDDPSGENPEPTVIFDSSELDGSSPFLPSYAPFALYDLSLFNNSVITSISFPFYGLADGYTKDSEGLYMPVYVVKSDFSTTRADCTVENGKKIILDFTGKLENIEKGDWLTVDVCITVGEDETLAFGDTDMAVLPGFLRGDQRYCFWNRVFDSKGANNHSLVFRIEGIKADSGFDIHIPEDQVAFSVMGDSISTYAGWSNNRAYNKTIGQNALWFPNNNYAGADMDVSSTWWHKAATDLGYGICVNNSWSGSCVTDAYTYEVRAKNLHNAEGRNPDVVVIFMGINDFAADKPLGDFGEAYKKMLSNIKTAYPEAEIYCCTVLPDGKRFSGRVNQNGDTVNDFNTVITAAAQEMGAEVIDLYEKSGVTYENLSSNTVDRLHLNADGMAKVAEIVKSKLKNE